MPNVINYAEMFERELHQKYSRELLSGALGTQSARFLNAKTIQIPRLDLAGYKDHDRNGGWNRQNLSNSWEPKELIHDRDVEFFVDTMDVDESNLTVSAANITNTFATEKAIPEIDSYRFSKIYSEYVTGFGKTPDTTALTAANALNVFDTMMENMDEAEAPQEGRVLYVTPATYTLIKNAAQVSRDISLTRAENDLNRRVRSLDDITIQSVPSSRMKSIYDFTDGAVPAAGAKQINMILLHPTAVISPIKHAVIYLFAPGQHTQGDGYLYQNRMYMDLFLIERRVGGVQLNVT